jgi:hypothetical protein
MTWQASCGRPCFVVQAPVDGHADTSNAERCENFYFMGTNNYYLMAGRYWLNDATHLKLPGR